MELYMIVALAYVVIDHQFTPPVMGIHPSAFNRENCELYLDSSEFKITQAEFAEAVVVLKKLEDHPTVIVKAVCVPDTRAGPNI
jgi:hypothetical protein